MPTEKPAYQSLQTAGGATKPPFSFSFGPFVQPSPLKVNFFTPIKNQATGPAASNATFGTYGPTFSFTAFQDQARANLQTLKSGTLGKTAASGVKLAADLGRVIPRSILSTALTLAPEGVRNRIGQIVPGEDLGKVGEIVLGKDAISTIPMEGSRFLLATGASEDTARQYGWLAGIALTAGDLFPGVPGKKKAAQEFVASFISKEGKKVEKTFTSREVAEAFLKSEGKSVADATITTRSIQLPPGKPPATAPKVAAGGAEATPRVVKRDFRTQAEKIFPLSKVDQENLIRRLDTLGLGRRTVMSVREAESIAQELGTDLAGLTKMAKIPEQGPVLMALKNTIATNRSFVAKTEASILRDPSLEPTLRPRIQAAEAEITEAVKVFVPGVSKAGRTFRMLQELAKETMDPIFWEARAQRMLGPRPLTPEMRAVMLNLIENQDRVGLTSFVMGLRSSSWAEKAATLWKAGLLTAFRTHEVNILGSVTVGALETATNVVSTSFDVLASLATGKRTIVFSPTAIGAKAKALVTSGPKKAVSFLRTGVYDESLIKKYDIPREVNFDNKILDGYTKAVFRTLAAEDTVFREAAIQEAFHIQARTIATNEKLRGAAYNDRVRELLMNPTNEMVTNAIDAAEYQTFSRESKLSNFLVSSKAQLQKADTLPGQLAGIATEFVFPFTGVPANIARTLAEYSPLGFVKAMLNVAKPSTRSQATFVRDISRALTGTGFISFGAYLADKGLMTGNAPTSKPERDMFYAEGKQPNAVFIGGQWWQINRISPAGNLLALGAEFNELGRTLEGYALYTATFWGGAKALSEMSFLQGASRAVSTIQDPEANAAAYGRSAAASLIPTIVGDIQNLVDPKMRVAGTIPEALKAKLPGLSTQVPVRRDVFGNAITEAGGRSTIINPVRQTRAVDNPVFKEARAIGVNIGLPDQTISGVKLDNFEYSMYQKVQGKLLEKTLTALISSDGYQLLSNVEKEKEMKQTITDLRTELNAVLFPALMITRYNLPPNTDPIKLRTLLKQLSTEERFRKLSRDKQEDVVKGLLSTP